MKVDVALIHAPSVYDFRERYTYASIISEVVPSLYVFDMIPYGFLTIASYLKRRGYEVAIINLASKMLHDPGFDVEGFLKRIDAEVYGIDFHWLVHAQGALEVSRVIKDLHPDRKVVLGGFSSTIFRYDILRRYPWIDAVFLGDSAEFPMLSYLERGPRSTPNLLWREDGRIKENPIRWVPNNLDEFPIDHSLLVSNAVRVGDIYLAVPYYSFVEAPIAAVISIKGCVNQCVTCGGSLHAFMTEFCRSSPALKSAKAIVREIESIASLSKMPIFIVGDLRVGKRLEEVSEGLRKLGIDNELVFEFFSPPSKHDLELVRRTSASVYLQISPESPDEEVRKRFGRNFGNDRLERMVRHSKELDFSRLDVYFMIGLPGQREDHSRIVADYFRRLRALSDRVDAFVSPLAPFVDPGSRAYHEPERYGYRILFRELEDYRRALLAPHWKYSLNYETVDLNREGIVLTSLDSYDLLNEAKLSEGLITEEAFELAKRRTEFDRKVMRLVDSGVEPSELGDVIEELAIKLDVKVKRSLALYPTKELVNCLRNPVLRGIASLLLNV